MSCSVCNWRESGDKVSKTTLRAFEDWVAQPDQQLELGFPQITYCCLERHHKGIGRLGWVDSLLRIDLKPHPQILTLILHILVHPGRTEPILDPLVLGILQLGMFLPVFDLQVHGLILLVVRARPRHRGQDVEADLTVRLRILDLGTLVGGFGRRGVSALVRQGPGHLSTQDERLEARVHDPTVDAERRVERGPHVAHGFQFRPDPRGSQGVFVLVQEDGAGVGVGEGRVGGFGRQHAALHARVRAFDFGDVEKAGCVSDQRAAGERTLRY